MYNIKGDIYEHRVKSRNSGILSRFNVQITFKYFFFQYQSRTQLVQSVPCRVVANIIIFHFFELYWQESVNTISGETWYGLAEESISQPIPWISVRVKRPWPPPKELWWIKKERQNVVFKEYSQMYKIMLGGRSRLLYSGQGTLSLLTLYDDDILPFVQWCFV